MKDLYYLVCGIMNFIIINYFNNSNFSKSQGGNIINSAMYYNI